MQEILKLIEGKWDMFGSPKKNNEIYFMDNAVKIVTRYSFSPVEIFTYSLADFANNKSVCEALARIRYEKVLPEYAQAGYTFPARMAHEINKLMLRHLYDHPNDAEGLANLVKEWVK